MIAEELPRLKKIESRIFEIARENGLDFCDIEFDIVPPQKMFEIMAYNLPGQISNWKHGRDYERTRTIYEKMGTGLPYEVVVHTDPARAYLMKDNTIALQSLIIAHVVAHVAFFTMNHNFKEADSDIASRLVNASQRFEDYEKKYGIDIVERTIDAGHAIMWHSTPFSGNETRDEKFDRIYNRMKKKKHDRAITEFSDFFEGDAPADIEREQWNHRLYMTLKKKTPIEPEEDLLRYIIDNARWLADWQKDILEVIRQLGQYYWPMMKTKYMNEGFATYWHEFIMRQLFREGMLNETEHAECNYANSLVKAKHKFSMNPYLIGSEVWYDIVDRWNRGRHGDKWEKIEDHIEKKKFDDGSMLGHEKMFRVLRTHTDWMFMNNFLTNDLIKELQLYMYFIHSNPFEERVVIADKIPDELRQIIIKTFAHSGIPKVYITNGDYYKRGELLLEHDFIGAILDPQYARKTLEHIAFLWGEKCSLKTVKSKREHVYTAEKPVIEDTFDETEFLPEDNRGGIRYKTHRASKPST